MRDRLQRAETFDALGPRATTRTPTDFIASVLPRRAAIQYVRETTDALHDHVAPLGALGDLDAYQWPLLLATHTERHIQQIEDVKEAVKSSA